MARNEAARFYLGAKSLLQRLVVCDEEAEASREEPGARCQLRARDEAAESLVPQLVGAEEWDPV